jgi:hypothetical protein
LVLKKIDECIVHVGMHKTGSTSIQNFFSKVGKIGDISYFDLGHPNHAERIYSMFTKNGVHIEHRKKGWSRDRIEDFKRDTEKRIEKSIENCDSDRMLISGEGILDLERDELSDMKRYLLRNFERVRIVAYVRPPKEYMESFFQELIKLGLGEFIVGNLFPKYRDIFEKFDRVFGEESVDLWLYDPANMVDNSVVTDFCHRIGVPCISEVSIPRNNPSLGMEALSILYIYRKFGPGYGVGPSVIKENLKTIEILRTIGGEKMRISSRLFEESLERHREHIEWIESRLGIDLRYVKDDTTRVVDREEDLLRPPREAVEKLARFIGKYPHEEDMAPEKISEMVHILRSSFSPDFETWKYSCGLNGSGQTPENGERRKIYLHIGSGKTGTTSIQRMLWENRFELKRRGVFYCTPPSETMINHHSIVRTPMDEGIWKRAEDTLSNIKKAFEISGCKTMIISTEKLLGVPVSYMEGFKNLFSDFDIKILVYIRNQVDLIPSYYMQRIKDYMHGPMCPIEDIFPRFTNNWGMEPRAVMDRWSAVFGKENIISRVYDRESLVDGNVCKDFSMVLGLESLVDLDFSYSDNRSLVPEVVELIRTIDELMDWNPQNISHRQSMVIGPLINVSEYHMAGDADEWREEFDRFAKSISDFIKKRVGHDSLEVMDSLKETRQLLESGGRMVMLSDAMVEKILDHYESVDFRFAKEFLNEREANVFLKHYRRTGRIKSLYDII